MNPIFRAPRCGHCLDSDLSEKRLLLRCVASLFVVCLACMTHLRPRDAPTPAGRPPTRPSPDIFKMDLSRRFNHDLIIVITVIKKNRASMLCMCMLNIYTRKTLTQHGQGGAQTLKPGQGARTQGYKQTCTEQRSTAWESKTACGIYIWPSRATVTGSPVLGVDGHHAQPRRTRAVRVSPCS